MHSHFCILLILQALLLYRRTRLRTYTYSIGVENTSIFTTALELSIRRLQPKQHHPSHDNAHEREACIARHSSDIFRRVTIRVQIWRVYERCHRYNIDQRERNSLLLGRLSQSCRDPAKNHTVDTIDTRGEQETCNISRGNIESQTADNEPN